MSRFIQLHLLTSYPPANLNRDDLGRPKTARMGGVQRLRISSQSLKRAWRDSELFGEAIKGFKGTRTKRIGLEWIHPILVGAASEDVATSWSKCIQQVYGEPDSLDKKQPETRKDLLNKQLVFLAPSEEKVLHEFINQLAALYKQEAVPDFVRDIDKQFKDYMKATGDKKKKLLTALVKSLREQLLNLKHGAADIAMFGRMLASSPTFNTEASAQVAHAISVHKVAVEDDFFTAVDDLNKGEKDLGAGHMGETEFAAGLFYLYACIDRNLLLKNLNGDQALANKSLAALVECAATIAPTGKQNSFASRARASYILCEKGDQQPRSLSVAFLKPVGGENMLGSAIRHLNETKDKMDSVYGACADVRCEMNAVSGEGSLTGIISCATGD